MDSTGECTSSEEDSITSGTHTLIPKAVFDCPEELLSAFHHNGPVTDIGREAADALEGKMEEALARNRKVNSKIDRQIEELQIRKMELAREDVGHYTALALCRKVRAPIRRLTFDVLREIAQHCVPSYPTGSSTEFPLVFTQVCSVWRAAALSSPRIWTTLCLTLKAIQSIDDMKRCRKLVKEWFKRAKQLPISLSIIVDDSYHDFLAIVNFGRLRSGLKTPLGKFLTSLSPLMPRTRQLKVKSTRESENVHPVFDHPVTWDLRILQRLEIQATEFHRSNFEGSLPRTANHLFAAAPMLTHLITDSMIVEREQLPHSLPWSQLTHVNIVSGMAVPDWVTVMELCPSLKTGIFGLKDFAATNFPLRFSRSTHDDLESLSLNMPTDIFSYSPLELLRPFRLPNLTNLDVSRGPRDDEETSTDAAHSSITPSISLKRLSFSDFRNNCLPELLRHTPNLCELSVATFSTFPSNILAAMTYVPRDDFSPDLNILPEITILNLEFNTTPTELPIIKILTKMLLSRTTKSAPVGCAPLEEVNIFIRDDDLKEVLQGELEKCKMNGVNLQLKLARWHNNIPKYVDSW